uniref:BI1-like protein n=1 Tax=Oryza punctata TaxID=4537 RepID=A0A0E0KIY1_ORYPU
MPIPPVTKQKQRTNLSPPLQTPPETERNGGETALEPSSPTWAPHASHCAATSDPPTAEPSGTFTSSLAPSSPPLVRLKIPRRSSHRHRKPHRRTRQIGEAKKPHRREEAEEKARKEGAYVHRRRERMYFRPPPKGPEWAGGDAEAGMAAAARPLYPMMLESPQLRWAFIRKVYTILSIQMLLTIAVASVVVFVRPVALFFVSTPAGFALYIFLIILPFIVLCPLYYYYQRHPVNLLLLALFTVAISFAVGLTCAFTKGEVILESAILTAVVVVSLTAYTFWAARRGHDFSFLGPFLFAAVMILMVFALIQIFFPLGRISLMIYGGLAALVFCGYIVYDTDNLIKRYSYDEYVWAAVALYLDVINLFLSLLTLFRASDS